MYMWVNERMSQRMAEWEGEPANEWAWSPERLIVEVHFRIWGAVKTCIESPGGNIPYDVLLLSLRELWELVEHVKASMSRHNNLYYRKYRVNNSYQHNSVGWSTSTTSQTIPPHLWTLRPHLWTLPHIFEHYLRIFEHYPTSLNTTSASLNTTPTSLNTTPHLWTLPYYGTFTVIFRVLL